MENLWNWLLRNFSNFLSFLSIGVTIYLGFFYVPSYLQDVQKEKIQNSKAVIEQSIKELIYSDSLCTYNDIRPLIRSQEIELNQSFPLSADDLLTEVQNSFFQDKFLPLAKRTQLIQKIEVLKAHLPIAVPGNKSNDNHASIFLTAISGIVSLFVVLLTILSAFRKYKEQRQVEEELISAKFAIDQLLPKSFAAMKFEEAVFTVLKNYPGIDIRKSPGNPDDSFDFEFSYKGKPYFVEVKYLVKSKLGASSFRRFLYKLNGLEGEFWLIHNQDLTAMVQNKFAEFGDLITARRQVRFIKAENAEELGRQLPKLLKD